MLPTDAKARKRIPLFTGFVCYFPDAMVEVAKASQAGNDQHMPGQPLHWDRSKSSDEPDAMMRHLLDHISGAPRDSDGVMHLGKAAWRLLAWLQKEIEAERKP